MNHNLKLLEKISKHVLTTTSEFSEVCQQIDQWSDLLNLCIKNFNLVEDNDESNGALFKLCFWIREGKDSFGICCEEDFEITLDAILFKVNQYYKVNLKLDLEYIKTI